MLVRIAPHAADSSTEIVLANAIALGLDARAMADGQGGVTVAIDGEMHDGALDIAGVVSVQRKHKPYMLATKDAKAAPSVIMVGDVAIGGAEPVILRCGLDRPGEFVVGSPIQVVNSVQWFQLADPDTQRSTWVSVDRPVYIALTLPNDSGPTPIQTMSDVIARSMPAVPIRPGPPR